MSAQALGRELLLEQAGEIARNARDLAAEQGNPDSLALVEELEALRVTIAASIAPTPEVELVSVEEPPGFEEGWAHVELMGHRQRYGHVRVRTLAHRDFLEIASWSSAQIQDACVDCGHRHLTGDPCTTLVPDPDDVDETSGVAAERKCGCVEHRHGPESLAAGAEPQQVELYSPSAVFAVTPLSEEQARRHGRVLDEVPF